MKWLSVFLAALSLTACALLDPDSGASGRAPAQVGVVNHTGSYIYSASVNGAGGGTCLPGALVVQASAAPPSPVSGTPA